MKHRLGEWKKEEKVDQDEARRLISFHRPWAIIVSNPSSDQDEGKILSAYCEEKDAFWFSGRRNGIRIAFLPDEIGSEICKGCGGSVRRKGGLCWDCYEEEK